MIKTIDNIEFSTDTKYKVNLIKDTGSDAEKGIVRIGITVDFGEKTVPEPVRIKWRCNVKNIYSQWNTNFWENGSINPDWGPISEKSRSASDAPIQVYTDHSGCNAVTVAVDDPLTPMEILSGVVEETAEVQYKLILFTQKISAIEHYEATLQIDTRKIPLADAVRRACGLWSRYSKSAYAPEFSKRPMYSTWYSYHQQLDTQKILSELKIAKELGMESVIVDDGWQTDDGNRGYAYCGDWNSVRIADMKAFVDSVHALGMKYIMWYSVPFVGVHSNAWERFRGKFLDKYDENHPWCVLDPRYPDVRDYLVGIYEKAAKEWGLDGFKLDFIDSFTLTEHSADFGGGMDYESLEEAVCALLFEAKSRLAKINPDVLIEFRQSYIGPVMQGCGNMLRVADCPMAADKNRRGIMGLRLMSDIVPAHSDMLMWNYDDSAESAALQVINAFFGVPQISVRLAEIPESHLRMLRFYLKIWNDNRDIIIGGKLHFKNPESGYSFVSAESENRIVAASYIGNVFTAEKRYDRIIYINGSCEDMLIFDNRAGKYDADYTVYDCTGNALCSGRITISDGLNRFDVPCSGVLRIEG